MATMTRQKNTSIHFTKLNITNIYWKNLVEWTNIFQEKMPQTAKFGILKNRATNLIKLKINKIA